MSLVGGVARQGAVALRVLRSLATAPYVLLYPPIMLVVVLGGMVASVAAAIFVASLLGEGMLATLGMFVAPIVAVLCYGFFAVAFCYEVNEVVSGRRPVPFSGVVAAARRLPTIVVVGTAGAVGMILSTHAQARVPGRLGRLLGTGTRQGLHVATVFAFPLIAITDGSFEETAEEFRTAMSEQWGAAAVTSVGFQAVTKLLFHLGFWPALALGAVNVVALLEPALPYAARLAEYAVFVDPFGPVTVPLALLGLAIGVPVLLKVSLGLVIKTILTRYALDGELPAGLRADVDELVEEDVDPAEESEAPGGGTPA